MDPKPWWKQKTTWSAVLLLANQLVKLWFPGFEQLLQTVDLILGTFTVIFLRQGVENARSSGAQAQARGGAQGDEQAAP